MKTAELIRLLQKADPSGELPVCIDNVSPYVVDVEPAYYDGCMQMLIEDPSLKPYYSIVGVKYISRGLKVQIKPLDVESAILDNPDLPVEYESDFANDWYKPKVETWREESRKIGADK